jgi:chaperone LolA
LFAGAAALGQETAVLFADSPTDLAADSTNESSVVADEWPAVLTEFLDSTSSYSAQFEQELWTEEQHLLEISRGSVELLRPNRFRWHYSEPYEQFIVADGETLWMYDVEIEQATRSAIRDTASASPAMLLNGDTAVRDEFQLVDTSIKDGITWVSLAPRVTTGEFSLVRMGFDATASGSLVLLEFVDGLNQTTRIHFTEVTTNHAIDPKLFQIDLPSGVNVLGDAG